MKAPAEGGFLNLHKPRGITSQSAVQEVRRALRALVAPKREAPLKVGHLGTLDPSAEGVLPVAIGKATRLWRWADLEPKVYRFELTFGVETDTFDAEGKVVARRQAVVDKEKIEKALARFRGSLLQTPPPFSAIKQGGRRLYDQARQGEPVTAPPRRIEIHALELLDLVPKESRATFEVVCSGGTYVRALGSDLGRALGCGAHVSSLVRLRAGVFLIEESRSLEEIARAPADFLLPLDFPLSHLPSLELGSEEAANIVRGAAVRRSELTVEAEGPWFRLHDGDGRLLAIARLSWDFLSKSTCLESRSITIAEEAPSEIP